MSTSVFNQVSKEEFAMITSRYEQWVTQLTDMDKDPVRVFEPFNKTIRDELALIREVSQELQQKKEDDIKKAAQAAEVQEEEKATEEQTEGKEETEEVVKSEEEKKEKSEEKSKTTKERKVLDTRK